MFKKFNENYLIKFILILSLSFLYFNFYISEDSIVPETDEVVSITTFSDIRTLFLKYIPNNHVLLSILGLITNSIFGVKILLLRTISFIFLSLILFITLKKSKYKITTVYLLLLISFYPLLIDYSFLYRGYILSSLFLTIIFFYLQNIQENIDNIKIIFVLSALLLFHSLSNVYLVIPLIFIISIYLIKQKKIIILNYFLIPLFILFSISIISTGIFLTKDLSLLENVEKVFSFSFLLKIFVLGFNAIFFPNIDATDIIRNFDKLIISIISNYIIFTIFILAMIKSIYKIIKTPILIDYLVIGFFVTFFLINKIPPERVLLGYAIFFILYLVHDIKNFENKIKYIIISVSFLIIILNFYNHDFYINKNVHLVDKKIIKKITNTNCELKLNSKNEFEYHYFYFKYLSDCNKIPNIFEFYKFYKSRN